MNTKTLITGSIISFCLILPSLAFPRGGEAATEESLPTRSGRFRRGGGSPVLSLSLEDAVLLALKRNRDLKVQTVLPKIKETLIEEAKSPFDLDMSLEIKAGKDKTRSLSTSSDSTEQDPQDSQDPDLDDFIFKLRNALISAEEETETQTTEGVFEISKLFSTGTKLQLELKSHYLDKESLTIYSDQFSIPSEGTGYATSGSLTITQSLLKDRGRKINLSLVDQAEIDHKISLYELQQYIIDLVAKVQKTYWDLILAEKTLHIRRKSMELANQQLVETEERIRVGKQAESEAVAAQAEVAEGKGKLIDAESAMVQKRLDFLLLLNPEIDILWDQGVELTTPPEPPPIDSGDIQNHISTAFRLRPDLNQTYLNLQKGDLEVVRTQNGLLPRLDFFFILKRIANGPSFPSSFDEFDDYGYTAGLTLSRPWGNRTAESQSQQANLERLQYRESIESLKQEIQVEVRKALSEIQRYHEQVAASEANRRWQEEKLKVEQEKFRLGRSTNLLVFQAQRDLIEAEVNKITAAINQIKASIDLQVAKGTLLRQWSIDILSPLAN
ncbi:MAG: TolC family protein [bacterium]